MGDRCRRTRGSRGFRTVVRPLGPSPDARAPRPKWLVFTRTSLWAPAGAVPDTQPDNPLYSES